MVWVSRPIIGKSRGHWSQRGPWGGGGADWKIACTWIWSSKAALLILTDSACHWWKTGSRMSAGNCHMVGTRKCHSEATYVGSLGGTGSHGRTCLASRSRCCWWWSSTGLQVKNCGTCSRCSWDAWFRDKAAVAVSAYDNVVVVAICHWRRYSLPIAGHD